LIVCTEASHRGQNYVLRQNYLVRPMLGVSPDAWAQANQTLGEAQSAIIIAAILERADVIRSPGGYRRTLTERAAEGKFAIMPMLEALR